MMTQVESQIEATSRSSGERNQSLPNSARQFSLRSLLCTIVTISMVLAYVRLFPRGVELAIADLVLGTLIGVGVGWSCGKLVEVVTWTLLGGTLALCCALTADRFQFEQQSYWLMVGHAGGLLAGVIAPLNILARVVSTIAAWLGCVAFGFWRLSLGPEFYLDALATLPALGMMALLAEVFGLLQRRHRTALDLWAAGLVLAIIAGNFGAILVWNLWYV